MHLFQQNTHLIYYKFNNNITHCLFTAILFCSRSWSIPSENICYTVETSWNSRGYKKKILCFLTALCRSLSIWIRSQWNHLNLFCLMKLLCCFWCRYTYLFTVFFRSILLSLHRLGLSTVYWIAYLTN